MKGKWLHPQCACNATVRVGTYQIRPINFTDELVVYRAPNVSLSDDVVISFGINGQQYNPDIVLNYKDIENTYTYYGVPIITSYFPEEGPETGGTVIKFKGFGFTPYRDNQGKILERPVWIRMRKIGTKIYTQSKEAEFVDSENVEWSTPPGETDTHYILEISLNNQDFTQIIMINKTYSYTYYVSPRISNIYPQFGPVSSPKPVTMFIKGTNFNCPDEKCQYLQVRFGKGDESVYVPGVKVNETEIHCQVPKFNKPDVVPVEITLDGYYFTTDKIEYGFYDPYIWRVTPKIVSKKGNTTITIKGNGFVNTTGTWLKIRYGDTNKKLICKGGPCIVMGKYIDKNTIEAQTFAYTDVIVEKTGFSLEREEQFSVEVSVFGDYFTENHIKILYFTEPNAIDANPSEVVSNGYEAILIPTNFLTNESYPKNPEKVQNSETIFREFGEAYCKFTSISGKTVITKAIMFHYPLKENESLNSISCPSPVWQLAEGVEEETVVLSISVNGGSDYSRVRLIKILERLDLFRIYPMCGPTYGKTKIRIIGTGLKYYQGVQIKWGVMNSIPLETTKIQMFSYSKERSLSQDPYENEIISLNDYEVKLMYREELKYGSLYTYSPRLPNFDRTHGGQVYVSLGKTQALTVQSWKPYYMQAYSSSFLEYYFYQQPTMKDMRPHGGSTTGGTKIVIRGSWFKYMPEYGVIPYMKIGEKVTRCEFESTVRIVCRAPPNEYTEAALSLSVGLNGVDFGETELKYHYYPPPIILDDNPKSGPESGGTRIHMTGVRFSNLSSPSEFKCRFTSLDLTMRPKYIPAIYENATSIICPSPGGWSSGSKVNIEVTFNGEEYTNSSMTFYFYSIISASPRSGPSDGTAGILTIEGSGFKNSDLIFCSFDQTRYKPLEVTWNAIKCKIPKAKNGDDFFGTVPLEVTINGIDWYRFDGGFHYYPQINVTDFYPKTGPAKGNAVIKFFGYNFRADFALAKPACKFGPYIGPAEVLSETEMLCHLPKIETFNMTYKVEAALNSLSFVKDLSQSDFVPYGIYDIDPYSGPIGIQTQLTVTGDGFSRDGKAKCRFGIPGDYAILEGIVLSNTKMLCMSPKSFEIIPKVMEPPYAVPFSISFFDEKINPWTGSKYKTKGTNASTESIYDAWTQTGHIFRFYKQPILMRITPKFCKIREIIDVYAYANPKTPFIQRNIDTINNVFSNDCNSS